MGADGDHLQHPQALRVNSGGGLRATTRNIRPVGGKSLRRWTQLKLYVLGSTCDVLLVAFDVVLNPGPEDEPIQPQAIALLARLIERPSQSGQRLINIYYHANIDERID
jgi:hypothetical protein